MYNVFLLLLIQVLWYWLFMHVSLIVNAIQYNGVGRRNILLIRGGGGGGRSTYIQVMYIIIGYFQKD